MSRNYVGAIGPFSEPILIYQLVAGIAIPNITVVWVNPIQVLVDVSDISVDDMMGVSKSAHSTIICCLCICSCDYVRYFTRILSFVGRYLQWIVVHYPSPSSNVRCLMKVRSNLNNWNSSNIIILANIAEWYFIDFGCKIVLRLLLIRTTNSAIKCEDLDGLKTSDK